MESENMDQIGNVDPILRMGIGSFADRLREVMGTDSARSFSDKIEFQKVQCGRSSRDGSQELTTHWQ